MKRALPVIITFLYIIIACSAAAQEIEVRGKVTDEQGVPLMGVNILIKNTSYGTSTDSSGSYTLKAKIGDILLISYVGYKTLETKIDSHYLAVQLLLKETDLDEVIVDNSNEYLFKIINKCPTIYISTSLPDTYKGNIYHPYQLIRGRVPGLTISKPGGDPLGVYDVYQRGQHSLLGKTEPLIVVDGLPGASLQTIDVEDIGSITIIRDAAQASLYGARGANGIIEIQSKKSNYDKKLKILYNGYIAAEQITNTPDVLSADSYRTLLTNPNSAFYNPASNFGAATDWAEAITGKGMSHAHHLAFRGSAKNTHYSLSFNYRDVNGVVNNSGFNQASTLLHLSQDLFKNKVNIRVNGGITRRNFTEIDKDIFYYAAIFNPTAPIRSDTARYGGYFQQQFFDYSNPVALLEQFDNQGEKNVYTAGLQAKWNIVSGLNARVQYGWQQQHYNRQYRVDEAIYPFNSTGNPLYNYNTELDLNNQSFITSLEYDFYKNDHNFKINGGYHYQEWTNELYNADEYDMVVNELQYVNVSFSARPDSAAIAYKNNTRLAAFFGQVQYDYNNWLFVNAQWRREGSTRFGDNRKWGNFYGFGAGVDLASLGQWADIQLFKLRLSYGLAGNLPVDGVYARSILRPTGKTLFNGNYIDIYTPAVNANPDLQWEARREWNAGLDAYFFNNRISASVDVYHSRTENMIYTYNASSPPNLAALSFANYVDYENRGVEIILNSKLYNNNDFSWDFGLNFARDRARFVSATTPQGVEIEQITPFVYLGIPGFCCSQPVVVEKGERLGNFIGLEFDRFEKGATVFKDQNGDKIIDDADRIMIGNALPDFTFGIQNSFKYKHLEFSFFLRGVMGHDLINTHRASYNFPGNITRYNVLQTAVAGENSQVLSASGISSYNIEDASFITLENLVFGYQFNPKSRYLSSLKMYVAAQNLFTLSQYSGLDPEVRLKNRGGDFVAGNALVPGLDTRVGYYPTRTFTLGIQAAF
ncbi:MAG: SusC/RagA family TonB-linked outer membrane protein [Saprospiraceae bacterium]